MDTTVFAVVMAAAVLHAGWNALLKIGLDRFLTASLIQIGAGCIALLALPFFNTPLTGAWPYIAISALLHIGYNIFLSRAYQHGDLSQAYPIARGSSPLLVALLALLAGDALHAGQWTGLLVLVGGIWLMAWRGGHGAAPNGPLLLNALATAACIAGYTLADALGARSNGDAIGYALWLFAVNGVVATTVITLRRGPRIFLQLGPHWRGGLAGGAMSMLAYGLVIWATTQAPVAMVSALRETSVLFALLIGWLFLKESMPALRLIACCVIAAGVALMKLA
ncbi:MULTISPECIES: EamA family transporter [unclassified Pseudomonas]|uniref:EamA family transporter n=1 Tax=unclassified Pseudomonas TaxID=196821 RepID=UPI002447AE24|nr:MULTISPECIES: EamA family transporter [unclassified Pseudomonas]MDG9924627.1 EamA family transporter [Pseudomonas sp. GD04045]MDH0033500.1 EamA family transporter [Pseudomonas sp. GD04019]